MDHDNPVAVRDAGLIPSALLWGRASVSDSTMRRSLPDEPTYWMTGSARSRATLFSVTTSPLG